MYLTNIDINYLLNYADIRSSDIRLNIEGQNVDPFEFSRTFISNSRVCFDMLDKPALANLIQKTQSYCLEIFKNYPFHQAFLNDYHEILNKHKFICQCRILILKNQKYNIDSNTKFTPRFYRNSHTDELNAIDKNIIEIGSNDTSEIYLLYSDIDYIKNEVKFSALTNQVGVDENINLLLNNSRAIEYVRENKDISNTYNTEVSDEIFIAQSQKHLPSLSYGKFSAMVDALSPYRRPLYFLQSWEVQFYQHHNIIQSMITDKRLLQRANGCYRIRDLTAKEHSMLLTDGILATEGEDVVVNNKVVLYAAPCDPFSYISSNGIYKWLNTADGLQGMNHLVTHQIASIGQGSIAQHLKGISNKSFLFAGLGLGLLQNIVNKNNIVTTVEKHAGIIRLYRDTMNFDEGDIHHQIIEGDIFDYVQCFSEYNYVIVDFAGGESFLTSKHIEQVVQATALGTEFIFNIKEPSEDMIEIIRLSLEDKESVVIEIEKPSNDFCQTIVYIKNENYDSNTYS